jgi:hypothetical protein
MKRTSYTVALLSLSVLASACADRLPTDLTRPTPSPVADLATDRYPTQAEYQSVCPNGIELQVDNPTSSFSGDLSQWTVSGHAKYNCVNSADATLSASVAYNSGGVANAASPWTLQWTQLTPTLSEINISPSLSASTVGNVCGITGSGSFSVNASMTFLDAPIWSSGETKAAPQVTLTNCEPVSPCGTEIISDGTCTDTGAGTTVGSGPSGGDCEEHEVIQQTSYDGGVTWEYDGVLYYYWVC